MYHHVKKLMYTVRVDEPDPRFGNMLLEQFGGANGELAAAMQYSIQGLNCEDPDRKDLLMDIGTEELSHLEVVGSLARLHLKPMKFDREKAYGMRLNIAAGTAVRFEPGEEKETELVTFGGSRQVFGFNSLVNGETGSPSGKQAALDNSAAFQFKNEKE